MEFEAFYNRQRKVIESDQGIWDAKQKAFAHFKVPKSKQGLLAIQSITSKQKQDFRFS